MYPYLKNKKFKPLNKIELSQIKKNVGAMIFHKVGGIVVNSTDSLIITKFLGLAITGIYSNYQIITQALKTITAQVFNAVVASIGNLAVNEKSEHTQEVFYKIFFLDFWIFGFCSICLITLFQPFIKIAFGNEYLLSFSTVVIISISFYISGMRQAVLSFKNATGAFYYDRYKPIFECIINILVSIYMVKEIGMPGVFIGTIISSLTTSCWIEPYVLYKHVFHCSMKKYFFRFFRYTILFVINLFLTYFVCSFINDGNIGLFIVKTMLCVFLSNLLFFFVFRKESEFIYYKNLVKSIINKVRHHKIKT